MHVIAWLFLQCKTSWPAMKATDPRGPALSGTEQGQESGESGWLWMYVETFKEPFDFPVG